MDDPRPDRLDPSGDAAPCRVTASTGPWVALVGAGPGDASLLTLRAAELLGAADVVLHDWLIGDDVLALARPGVRLVDVGKAKGRGSSQRHIEQLLVAHHGDGRRVVRLKGGDPFLFGRGMEEVRACRRAGFDVEVVPGVSSALAAPLLGGISITDRTISAQVAIVAGHRVDGDNDWAALARSPGTLVVLMAASTGPAIARRLIDEGLPDGTAVAVVVAAGHPVQQVLRGTAGALARRTTALPGPCVLVIGAVAERTEGVAAMLGSVATAVA